VASGTPVQRNQKDNLQGRIHLVRGVRVMLDADLARLYGVSTKRLNEAVSRNLERFPNDFMFRLGRAEATLLKSQIATSKPGRGGRRRSTPRAFTEQGIAMLSGVLRSSRAVAVNVEIMRAFVRLRRLHGEHADLVQRIAELESRFDRRFRLVFDAIRALQAPAPDQERGPIGFRPPR
jgi:hypothetical protein